MQYEEAKQGRVFVLRLEHGETVHEVIEAFAREKNVSAAAVIAVGGVDEGSRLVVGPEAGNELPVSTMVHVLDNVHEIAGTGTLFPDENGDPVLHMHMACGRTSQTITGCIRNGVKVWQILEVIVFEMVETTGKRIFQPDLGFNLLRIPKRRRGENSRCSSEI
jgi:predicted DNA-binding protein with PD1-like motif